MYFDEDQIVSGTRDEVTWWIENRVESKFTELHKDSMNVNPFLLPLVSALHSTDTVEELGELLLAAHLVVGHNTGFGKLVDEKLLPKVFGTEKLSAKFRASTPPYTQAAFNDIDHLVHRDGYVDLLSLKASPWSLNLGGAMNLNKSFHEIRDYQIEPNPGKYGKIVVGVYYGRKSTLTDKYGVLRGETDVQRKKHKVADLTDVVEVHAGSEFWSWLNEGEPDTQAWVLDGVLEAAATFGTKSNQKELLARLVASSLSLHALGVETELDWESFLVGVNGGSRRGGSS